MGVERAHSELLAEGGSLSVEALGLFRIEELALRGDVAEEPERVGLVASLLVLAGEANGLLGGVERVGRPALR
jgi:hypothetical protein